jgi:hypothetical protein
MKMELTTYDVDVFAAFANAASALAGGDSKPLLKFAKGDWVCGQDSEEVPVGAKFAADVMNAEWGWVRWYDRKPVERRMCLVASGQQPATRDALGHDDRQLWSLGNDSTPQDPWQKVFEIPVREIDGERREFILTGSSKGFEGGCKQLFAAFGKGMRENAGKVPVIALGVSKYKHSNPAFGTIKTPEMTLVEWFAPGAKAEPKKLAATKF